MLRSIFLAIVIIAAMAGLAVVRTASDTRLHRVPPEAPTASAAWSRVPVNRPDAYEPLDTQPMAATIGPSSVDAPSPDASRDESLGGFPLPEPVDEEWAPGMEATLDSVIRSIGWPVSDTEIRCLTTRCSVRLFYQPSFYFLEGEAAAKAELALLDDLGEALDTVLRTSTRLSSFSGAPLVLLSSMVPEGSDRGVPEGSSFGAEGVVGGSFLLSGETVAGAAD